MNLINTTLVDHPLIPKIPSDRAIRSAITETWLVIALRCAFTMPIGGHRILNHIADTLLMVCVHDQGSQMVCASWAITVTYNK
jgi:hypothetical protein